MRRIPAHVGPRREVAVALALTLILGALAGLATPVPVDDPSHAPDDDRPRQAVRGFEADRFFGDVVDRTARATPAEGLRLPDGFRAELLYTVPREQGS